MAYGGSDEVVAAGDACKVAHRREKVSSTAANRAAQLLVDAAACLSGLLDLTNCLVERRGGASGAGGGGAGASGDGGDEDGDDDGAGSLRSGVSGTTASKPSPHESRQLVPAETPLALDTLAERLLRVVGDDHAPRPPQTPLNENEYQLASMSELFGDLDLEGIADALANGQKFVPSWSSRASTVKGGGSVAGSAHGGGGGAKPRAAKKSGFSFIGLTDDQYRQSMAAASSSSLHTLGLPGKGKGKGKRGGAPGGAPGGAGTQAPPGATANAFGGSSDHAGLLPPLPAAPGGGGGGGGGSSSMPELASRRYGYAADDAEAVAIGHGSRSHSMLRSASSALDAVVELQLSMRNARDSTNIRIPLDSLDGVAEEGDDVPSDDEHDPWTSGRPGSTGGERMPSRGSVRSGAYAGRSKREPRLGLAPKPGGKLPPADGAAGGGGSKAVKGGASRGKR